ncbi:isochorismatase family protein [Rhizodiscina lignyota]|uniref:Isochorismatase family protein n=1 Tax=Rhizodiscina lignyota TaxID=1504668 RepID=A0A9P4M125_9PEZI|nr:isochorismatase family protein [Rhizodiscina lignyota]
MSKTAFVLLDLQVGILERVKDGTTNYLSRVSEAIKASRAAGIPIIYVKTCFRAGHPEVSSRNFSAAKIASFGSFVEGDAPVEISPEVAPLKSDIVVTKRRVSAFSGSDLDVVLRGLNVDSLVLAGVATSGAVLSTVRQAADLDFSLTVIGDLCLDLDAEVHKVLVEKIFSRQARTLSTEEWIQGLSKE